MLFHVPVNISGYISRDITGSNEKRKKRNIVSQCPHTYC